MGTKRIIIPVDTELVAYEIDGGNSIVILECDFDAVSVQASHTPNQEDAFPLNKELRGKKWKLNDSFNQPCTHEHFYIWTQGTSALDIVVEVSDNGEFAKYYFA